jgi:hypothetical protein
LFFFLFSIPDKRESIGPFGNFTLQFVICCSVLKQNKLFVLWFEIVPHLIFSPKCSHMYLNHLFLSLGLWLFGKESLYI